MSSTEEYQNNSSEGLQIPGLVRNQETVEQLAFGREPVPPFPGSWSPTRPLSSPGMGGMETVASPISTPNARYPLTPIPISSLPSTEQLKLEALKGTTALRPPVVIRGSNKQKRSIRPAQGRRH